MTWNLLCQFLGYGLAEEHLSGQRILILGISATNLQPLNSIERVTPNLNSILPMETPNMKTAVV